ncbi:MAG TPA: TIGR00730 family Rossman fold protein [Granulicella sp.]
MRYCVFSGSSWGVREEYAQAAEELGKTLAERGIGVVYGGASVGLMGTMADAALAAGGEVIGVIPQALMAREIGHKGLTELHVTDSMHTRKAMMADLSDGFIALPGGVGTFEETFEIWTWAQLGHHQKPCALLNVAGFYDGLVGWLDRVVEEGFIKPNYRGTLLCENTVEQTLEAMAQYKAPELGGKWIKRGER